MPCRPDTSLLRSAGLLDDCAPSCALQLVGYERVSYYTGSGKSRRHHYHTDDFLQIAAQLGPAGKMPTGQYQFAFSFALPPDLPATFQLHCHGDE